MGRAIEPPTEKEAHTLERLGIYSSSAVDKGKRGNVTANNQENNNNAQKVSTQNRATLAKTVLNLIAFVQKQAPVTNCL